MGKGKFKQKIKGLKDKIKESVKKVPFAPLLPFKGILVSALKKKGYNVDLKTDMEKLAVAFYEVFVKKNKAYKINYDTVKSELDPVLTNTIITAIIAFIRELKKKKEQGIELNSTENEILDQANKVADVVEDFKEEQISLNIGEMVKKYWWVLLLLIYFLMRKK